MVDVPIRTYVLDTSVLLADPAAIRRFSEHNVVLPLVVISELEGKLTIRNWAGLPGSRSGCWMTCGSGTDGSIFRCR
jgi:hypothetical protein